ncbi:MAG TPA: DedA family protein, partial [Patescibacteria group bacterium]|nr:DedA family protein [Patescibacteria group bacterium]
IESSLIPMPSEIIIPPAAYLASQGSMNIWLIVVAGLFGSIVGASFNYFLGFYLGRPLVYKLANHRLAKFLLINTEKIKRAEKYFLDNSASATFVGRLIPVIRQLISIPAGFSKMPFGSFLFYTTLGSFVWVMLLAALGFFIGNNQHLLSKYYTEISWGLLIAASLYIGWRIFKVVNKKNSV